MEHSTTILDLSGCCIGNDGEVLENDREEPDFPVFIDIVDKVDKAMSNILEVADNYHQERYDYDAEDICYEEWCMLLTDAINTTCAELRDVKEKISKFL